jgi:hypothetical protein
MLDRDDADDFIAEMLEEWYAKVDNIIYNKYIERQLVPYTVTQAKDAILQIIEVSSSFLFAINSLFLLESYNAWLTLNILFIWQSNQFINVTNLASQFFISIIN